MTQRFVCLFVCSRISSHRRFLFLVCSFSPSATSYSYVSIPFHGPHVSLLHEPQTSMAQQPPLILRLPVELRLKIYRHSLISDLGYGRRTALWRPVAADEKIFKIGYFTRDSILPLLLVNRQIHNEAIKVLYGENTFVCQVSGFSDQPIAFLDRLPAKYLDLLQRFYVQTGYQLEGKIDRRHHSSKRFADQAPVVQNHLRRRDVISSAELLMNALPSDFPISVNTKSVIRCSPRELIVENINELWGNDHLHEWAYSSWHLWKMVPTKVHEGNGFKGRRMEFCRLV